MADSTSSGVAPERRVQVICLLVLAVIATGAALQAMGDVMIPFALAMFLAIALAPVVDGLEVRTRLSRPVAVGLTMLLGVLLLAVLGGIVASSVADYQAFGDDVSEPSTERVPELVESDAEGAAGAEPWKPSGFVNALIGILPESMLTPEIIPVLKSVDEKLGALLPGLVGLLGTVLSQGVTVMIFLLFLLLEQRRSPRRAAGAGMGNEVRERVKQYISVKVLTSAVTGIGVGVALWAIGAPMPMLFGLLSFVLNFIPTIGSIIAVALPLPVLLSADASVVTIILALLLPGAIQFVVGQIWENKLLGDAFDLRASIVLLGLVFWGKIWGIVGMILATPITAVLKTLMEGQELTRPVARLMGQEAQSDSAPPRS